NLVEAFLAGFLCHPGIHIGPLEVFAGSGVLQVLWLDMFRAAWGGPVRINSGFRCPAHNAEAGGAKQSRHLLGCAADIAPLSGDLGRFKALARRMFGLPGWELKEYPTFMHVAVPREESARKWGGGGVRL
nr:hypothetical protein [Fretibacterium sp.]